MLLISYLGVSVLTLILLIHFVERTMNKVKEENIIEKYNLKPKQLSLFIEYLKFAIVSFIPIVNIIILIFLIIFIISHQDENIIAGAINKVEQQARNRKEIN